MNFAAYQFWSNLAFGILVAVSCSLIAKFFFPKWRQDVEKSSFLLISLFLLYQESFTTLLAFSWVVVLGWLCIKNCNRSSRYLKHLWLVLLALQLAPLLYFKYWSFLIGEVLGFELEKLPALIPMGLSFYTFQVLSFCLDTRKLKLAEPRFLDYFNFAAFFPQIVAGPIERRSDLLPQIEKLRLRVTLENLEKAIPWLALGFFYKMALADNIAIVSQGLRVDSGNVYQVGIETLLYTFRIYFDFAGYSFIALGLGLLFGINLTLNFLSPYWSTSIREFWRRWHVTLSQWLRDYVYFALGGNRRGIVWLNILITFIVSGIWHGAGWNFIIWGALHGLALVFISYPKLPKVPRFVSWSITMFFVSLTWLVFFESDIHVLSAKISSFFTPSAWFHPVWPSLKIAAGGGSGITLLAFLMALSVGAIFLEGLSLRKQPYCLFRKPIFVFGMIVLTFILAPVQESEFIYFNF